MEKPTRPDPYELGADLPGPPPRVDPAENPVGSRTAHPDGPAPDDGPDAFDDGQAGHDSQAGHGSGNADAFDAARLIAFGLRPRLVPARDGTYTELVRRYLRDPAFAALTRAVATGLGLVVLDVSERAGLVPAGAEDSAFTVRISDYARRAGGEHRSAERLLHALAQLAIAALAYPRPADLLDNTYVGRVSVEGVDAFVREACRLLDQRVAADPGDGGDPLAGEHGLEAAWRLYARRPAAGATRDSRRLAGSTTGIIARAMGFLADSGCLVPVGEQAGGTFRTTARYQVQVRELAADAALEELLDLGVVTVADGSGGVRVLTAEPPLPGTDPRATAVAGPLGAGHPRHGDGARRGPGSDEPGLGEARPVDHGLGEAPGV